MKSAYRLLLAFVMFGSIAAAQNMPPARTDLYHVHFAKAALGKGAELADYLKTSNPNEPMSSHRIVLRHQDGEDWDYAVIAHLGTKTTVDAAGTAVSATVRDLYAWHTDTLSTAHHGLTSARPWGLTRARLRKRQGRCT